MRWIEKSDFERNALVEKYSDYDFPYINLGENIDVGGLYTFAKENGLSFYCTMIYFATRAALQIKNFSYRIVDGKPAICDKLTPVFTYLPQGEEQFFLVKEPYTNNLIEFSTSARNTALRMAADKEKEYMFDDSDMEILYISCIPWVSYTHFIRTIHHGGEDNVPRLSWGKYFTDWDGRLKMPFSVQVHHGLMDGYHVGMYFQILKEMLVEL